MEQMNLNQAIENKNKGIKQAEESTEEKVPQWGEKALEFLKRFPKQEFMIEELREWAYIHGLRRPVHERAWGAVIKKAQKEGLVKHCGIGRVKGAKTHRGYASVWKKI